jgi:multisubunit Na+/H+ antiporter MnhG subunit
MTDIRRRSEPLRVEAPPAPAVPHAPPPPAADGSYGIGHVETAHPRTDEDRRAFADAVRALRTGAGSLNLSERTLMVLGGVIAPLGLLVVLLGWVGASRTPNLFEQIPYLISGGLFGLALVFLGSFFYFAHWLTELVKEHRTQSAALLAAITELRDEIGRGPDGGGAVAGPVALVATSRGSMVHRPECAVVAGKDDLRAVVAQDGLAPCKLCDPYEEPSALS